MEQSEMQTFLCPDTIVCMCSLLFDKISIKRCSLSIDNFSNEVYLLPDRWLNCTMPVSAKETIKKVHTIVNKVAEEYGQNAAHFYRRCFRQASQFHLFPIRSLHARMMSKYLFAQFRRMNLRRCLSKAPSGSHALRGGTDH